MGSTNRIAIMISPDRVITTLCIISAFCSVTFATDSKYWNDIGVSEETAAVLQSDWWVTHRLVFSIDQEDEIGEEKTIELLRELLAIHRREKVTSKRAYRRFERVKYILDAYEVSKDKCSFPYLKELTHRIETHFMYEANILLLLEKIQERQLKICYGRYEHKELEPYPNPIIPERPKRKSTIAKKCSRFLKSCF